MDQYLTQPQQEIFISIKNDIESIKGKIDPAYLQIVAHMAIAILDFIEAEKQLAKDGKYLVNTQGNLVRHPALIERKSALENWKRSISSMGLSPNDEARIQRTLSDAATSDLSEEFSID